MASPMSCRTAASRQLLLRLRTPRRRYHGRPPGLPTRTFPPPAAAPPPPPSWGRLLPGHGAAFSSAMVSHCTAASFFYGALALSHPRFGLPCARSFFPPPLGVRDAPAQQIGVVHSSVPWVEPPHLRLSPALPHPQKRGVGDARSHHPARSLPSQFRDSRRRRFRARLPPSVRLHFGQQQFGGQMGSGALLLRGHAAPVRSPGRSP